MTDTSLNSGKREYRVAVRVYVKVIWSLSDDPRSSSVSTGAIAVELGVSGPSASTMVRRLEADGLIQRERYRGVRLTDRGHALALEVVRHHRLLGTFLARTLGMSWERVHAEAEILEHHISEDLADLIDDHLGNPEFDPHGHPIPRRDGSIPTMLLRSLADLLAGDGGVIAQVRDDAPDVLHVLEARGLVVGARVEVVSVEPVGGTIALRTEGIETRVLGFALARRIDLKGTA